MKASKLTTVAFKCNEEESERLKDMAATAGCSVSKFVHDLVIDAINRESLGSSSGKLDFPLILPAKLQEHFVQGIILSNLLTQKRMIDNGKEDLFRQASARATEIVQAMLPDGWSDVETERDVVAGD